MHHLCPITQYSTKCMVAAMGHVLVPYGQSVMALALGTSEGTIRYF